MQNLAWSELGLTRKLRFTLLTIESSYYLLSADPIDDKGIDKFFQGNIILNRCNTIFPFLQYPESVMFRDCSDLNFKEYLDIIKEPIALDVIKEKLDRDNPEMVSS